ncbi:MAG: hemerythrin domain-containing protein [Candidatus Rokubacteria bacterium]|nr:hemerythrin domain-containing protein [Candidatus Rokubacteria bacterium]
MTTSSTAILRKDHELILRALALLERLADRLDPGEAADEPARKWLLDFFTTFVDGCHHRKEEQHLFPALEQRGIPRHGGPVGVMLADHDEGRRMVRALADGPDRMRGDLIRRYAALLRGHIHTENDVLFVIADHVLERERQRELVTAFRTVEAEVVGPGVHECLLADLARMETGAPPMTARATAESRAGRGSRPSPT